MNKNLHDIDRYFKENIEGHREESDDRVWAAIESKLDKHDLVQTQYKYRFLRNAIAISLLIGVVTAAGLFSFNYTVPKTTPVIPYSKIEKQTIKSTNPVVVKTKEKIKLSTIANDTKSHLKKKIEKIVANGQSVVSNDQKTKYATRNINQDVLKVDENSLLAEVVNKEEKTDLNTTILTENTKPYDIVKRIEIITLLPKSIKSSNKISEQLLIKVFPNTSMSLTKMTSNKMAKTGKFYIAAAWMPESIHQNIKEGRNEHREDDRHLIKAKEEIVSSTSLGITLNYVLNSKWQLFTGAMQSTTRSTIFEQNIFARPRRERPGQNPGTDNSYKINCAAGYAYVTNKSGSALPTPGDSIKALPSSSQLVYTVIPTGIKYMISNNKLSMSALGGINFYFLSRANIIANTIDQTGVKTTEIVSVQGLNKSYIAAVAGLSLSYKIMSSLSLYCNPITSIGINAINQQTPVKTTRTTFGLQTGISLSF